MERYLAGEHEAVWDDLQALGDRVRQPEMLADARAVAAETMRRVRHDVELLAAHWAALGYRFGYGLPDGPQWFDEGDAPGLFDPATPESIAVLDAYEAEVGPLPLSLRAFAAVVGAVSFVGVAPDDRWPESEEMDAFQVESLAAHLAAAPRRGEHDLVLFPDSVIKAGYGGVGPVTARVPDPAADAILRFEGEALDDGGGGEMCFVPYLRSALLARAGIGPFGGAEACPPLLAGFILLPF